MSRLNRAFGYLLFRNGGDTGSIPLTGRQKLSSVLFRSHPKLQSADQNYSKLVGE